VAGLDQPGRARLRTVIRPKPTHRKDCRGDHCFHGVPPVAGLGSGAGHADDEGWAANHLAALLPVLRTAQSLSASLVAGLYGLYAVGLLPGLLLGGSASDRLGRRAVAVPGALLTAVRTLILLFRHDPTGLVVGRWWSGPAPGRRSAPAPPGPPTWAVRPA